MYIVLLALGSFVALLGLREKLLIKPKAGSSLQTERVPRSSGENSHAATVLALTWFLKDRGVMCVLSCCVSVLERLQSFLPQMAKANEKLKQQIEEAPAGYFDIESVDGAQRIIEMVSVLLHLFTEIFILTLDVVALD